jgi:hypothetical protein
MPLHQPLVPCWPRTEEDPMHSILLPILRVAPFPPIDVGRLRNTGGHVPQSWTEACAQLRSTSGLLGALVGNNHPVILAYRRLLRMYERM